MYLCSMRYCFGLLIKLLMIWRISQNLLVICHWEELLSYYTWPSLSHLPWESFLINGKFQSPIQSLMLGKGWACDSSTIGPAVVFKASGGIVLAFQRNFARAVVHSLQLACTLNSLKGTQSEDLFTKTFFFLFNADIFICKLFIWFYQYLCYRSIFVASFNSSRLSHVGWLKITRGIIEREMLAYNKCLQVLPIMALFMASETQPARHRIVELMACFYDTGSDVDF